MSPAKAHRTLAVALLGITLGCGDPAYEAESRVGVATAGVVGGWAATADQIFATVEIRRAGARSGFCSGALVSPSVVVTAAHCAVVEPELGVVRPAAPASLWVAAGHLRSLAADEARVRVVSEVRVHQDYNHDFIMGRSRDGAGQGGIGSPNDIALLLLAQGYRDVPLAPLLPPERASETLRHGEVAFVAGYGIFDVDDGRGGELYISEAVIDIIGRRELLTRPIDRLGDSCFGDSGGPLYLPTEEGDYVVGLVSRGRSDVERDCGDGGVYTLLSAHMDWMADVAGDRFQPLLEPQVDDLSFLQEGVDALQVPKGGSLRRVRSCSAHVSREGHGPLSALVLLCATIVGVRRLSRTCP